MTLCKQLKFELKGSHPLVILPTYNERENLLPLVADIFSNLQTHLLIIDDHSPDGTGDLAEQIARAHENVFVLHRPGKMGLGSAYVRGFEWALERDFDPILQMDSDFSHAPGDLPKLIQALETCDLALGSRYIPEGGIQNWPRHRLWISGLGNLYARSILGLQVRDLTGGFKAFRRQVLESFALKEILSDGYAFQIETTYRALQKGFRVAEIPIVFKDRTRGQSKISRKVVWEAAWNVWRLKLVG